jgi:putative acetyltransferase
MIHPVRAEKPAANTEARHMLIRKDNLQGPEIARLLRAHLENAAEHSPPESIHALNLDALRAPEITFWTAWEGRDLLGCGALKELDANHGEIKSMHTTERHRRRGVAAGMLRHIIQEARRRSYQRLSLETGSMDGFAPARALYARFGFETCGPFADYVVDSHSTFMTLELPTALAHHWPIESGRPRRTSP